MAFRAVIYSNWLSQTNESAKSMKSIHIVLFSTCLLLIPAGCTRSSKMAARTVMKESSSHSIAPYSPPMARLSTKVSAASMQRFIAVTHKLDVISSESELPKAWESVVNFCATIQCEVVSSSITNKTSNSAPSGSMTLRVSPDDLKKLFTYVEKQGRIAQHTTESEDKTTEVVDTEAKIKNLTSFRDNLRAMLAKPSATVKDLVEIQGQLTETQTQLDSENAQRKILANETEKVAVEIEFRVDEPIGNARGFAQITNAFREAGSDLAESTAWLITFIVTVIPWLILIVPLGWLLFRALRRWRHGRPTSPPPSSAAA